MPTITPAKQVQNNQMTLIQLGDPPQQHQPVAAGPVA